MATKLKQRKMEIDVVRGLGIIFVVALHVGLPSVFWTNLIGSFHMAIFIFCSGWCFSENSLLEKNGIFKVLLKKIRTLYVPYVLFNSAMILLNNLFVRINVYTDNEIFTQADIGIANFYGLKYRMSFTEMLHQIWGCVLFGKYGETQPGGATWFLRVLFFITTVFFLIQWCVTLVCKENTEKISRWTQVVISVAFLIVGWKGHKENWINTYQYLTCCSIYFVCVLGWLISKSGFLEKLKHDFMFAFGIFSISMVVLTLVTPDAAVGINANSYTSPCHLIAASIFGILACFTVASQIVKIKYLSNLCSIIGRYSLLIMMFHFLALKVITLSEVLYYDEPFCYIATFPVLHANGIWRVLYISVGVLLPVCLAFLWNKMKNIWINRGII